jgi:hypothetical protein
MAKKTLPQFGLGSYNPMSGYRIQPRVVQNEDPMLSGGASTMTGSSMPDSMLNKIRQAAGLGRVGNNPVNVPVQESESGLVDKIRQSSIGQLFATDPVLKARMEAASAPVSPFQEQDDAFDLAPTEVDVFSIGGRGGLDAERMPLTGTSDQPGQETFGGTVPLELSSDPDEIFEDSSTVSKSQKRADESEAEFNARIEREERGIFDEDTSGAGSGTGSDDSKVETGSGSIDLMKSALDSYNDMVGLAPSGAKSMAEYKKEFSEATGIDISGDPDNKAALTAFGLALMQNKAGRGFNVGNMLSAVGAAGEKALPLMAEARKEAREGKIAAGRYALGKAGEADSARQKFLVDQSTYLRNRKDQILDYMQSRRDTLTDNAEKQAFDREKLAVEYGFKNAKARNDALIEADKAKRKGSKIDSQYNRAPQYTQQKIRIGFTDDGSREVYANPRQDGAEIANSYVKLQRSQEAMGRLDALLADIEEGGMPAARILLDRGKNILIAGGVADPDALFAKELKGVSAEDQANAILNVLIMENKRFATQETGNGISNQDREDLATSFGKIDIIGNPRAARIKLAELRTIFNAPLNSLEQELSDFYELKDMYRNEDIYNQTVSRMDAILAASPYNKIPNEPGDDGVIRFGQGDY